MIKNKLSVKIFFIFILIFITTNFAKAGELDSNLAKYPDYAQTYTGHDGWENFNRKVFIFNLKANKYIMKPINIVWASVMPQAGMDRIQDFYTNVNYPLRLVSTLLQKDFQSTKTETKRFSINTTQGWVGFYDVAAAKYKIEPHNENMEQALAYYNLPKGNYVVVPIVAQGNTRDIVGELLDLPFDPTSYIVGPISLISTGVSLLNDTTKLQPIFNATSEYADPYQISKTADGLNHYIQNNNLDRKKVLKEKETIEKIQNVNDLKPDAPTEISTNAIAQEEAEIPSTTSTEQADITPDIVLSDYNPQGPLVDAMRTILFDNQKIDSSKWAELSVWNKTFAKRIKTASVSIINQRPKYHYRYILRPDKNSPVAIIYPSIGEGIMSNESVVQAKLLYDEGYSVIILGSAFQWEFVKSMPKDYCPGLPYNDAEFLRQATLDVLNNLQKKKACKFSKKIIVGNSFGALTSLFVAADEAQQNTLGVSKFVTINPPIELLYALQQLDNSSGDLKNISNLDLKTAIITQKINEVTKNVENGSIQTQDLPFTQEEAKIAISFALRQKLSDVVFELKNCPTSRKSDFYNEFDNMSFYDYAEKYLISKQNKPLDEIKYDASLYSIENYLKNNDNYRIYQTMDDFFVNKEQLRWLKATTGSKSVIFSNGSHLGFLYRAEFIKQLWEDTHL